MLRAEDIRLRFLAKPKFLVPLVLLVWLLAALPLSISSSQAEVVSDSTCSDTTNWSRGVWGMNASPAHLTLVDPSNACYKTTGTLVWGEWWRDYPNDSYGCKTTDQQTAYSTCSDEDMNWYLRLDDATSVGVTPTEINNLQRWSECKAGYTDPAQWCNFLTETLPQGGNYGMWDPATYDWNPTNDQPQLPNPCLDYDYGNPNATQSNPCKGKNIRVAYTGARVFDNNHGWKEIHPVRKEAWSGSSGSGCYSVNETYQASPNTCTDTVPAASSGTGSTTYSQTVDNADSSRFFVNSLSHWYTSSWNSQRYGSNYKYHWPSYSDYYAWYKVNMPAAGNYAVYGWWGADPGYNSSAAYWIWTTNGWVKKNVDQRTNGGKWVYLGTYAMNHEDDWDICVDYGYYSSSTGYIIADAVRIVKQ